MVSTDEVLGAGLYETVRVDGGAIRFGHRHLARLRRSAAALGLPDVDERAFRAAVREADGDGPVVRVTLHAGADGGGVVAGVRRAALAGGPVRLISLPGWYARGYALREHKLTSHFHGIWSRRLAERAGAAEGLLVERASGLVGEAGNANVAALLGGRLVTPPVDGLLPGLGRAALIEAAPAFGLAVEERALPLGELLQADAVLLTSSPRGVTAAASLDGEPLRSPAAGLLDALAQALDRRARDEALPL